MNPNEPTDPNAKIGDNSEPSKDWIYRDSTKRLLWGLLGGGCFAAFIAEAFLHRHAHFEIDRALGFYALLGFGMCAVMIIVAKGLGYVLKVRPDFYQRHGEPEAPADAPNPQDPAP